jgi:predicted dehydrogenase
MRNFKICHIGCGGMSVRGHGPALKKYSEEFPDTELAGCCDLDESRAEEFKRFFGFTKSYTHWRSMLNEIKPDAVCLVVPVKFTADIAYEILKAGYNLLTEKPPGMTKDECNHILFGVDESGKKAMAAFNRRYMPLVKKLKKMVGEETLDHIRYDFLRVSRKDPDFSTTAIHGIDTVKMIAGCDYTAVTVEYQGLDSTPVGNIFIDGKMSSGTTVSLNFYPDSGLTAERVTLIAGSKTWFLNIPIWDCPDYPGNILYYENGELKESITGELTDKFISSGFYDEHKDFYEAVRNDMPVPHNISDSYQSVELMELIRGKRTIFPSKP